MIERGLIAGQMAGQIVGHGLYVLHIKEPTMQHLHDLSVM